MDNLLLSDTLIVDEGLGLCVINDDGYLSPVYGMADAWERDRQIVVANDSAPTDETKRILERYE